MQIVEATLGEPLDAFLTRRYEGDGATLEQIAGDLGTDTSTVSRWMAHFGIQTRLFGRRRTTAA